MPAKTHRAAILVARPEDVNRRGNRTGAIGGRVRTIRIGRDEMAIDTMRPVQ